MLKEKGIDAIAYFNAQDNAGSIGVIALIEDDLQLVSENGVAVVGNGDEGILVGLSAKEKIILKEKMSKHTSSIKLNYAKPIIHTSQEYNDIEQYAKERGVKIYLVHQFDGDISLLKEQLDVISNIQKEYGYKGKITIRFAINDKRELASVSKSGDSITFNKLALRNREATNLFLNEDNNLSSTNTNGIVAHEMGHILQKYYGNVALDIAKKTYYNLYKEYPSTKHIIDYMLKNISKYSVVRSEKGLDKPFKSNQLKEIIPEVFGKNATDSNEFCNEFIKLLKEVWKI